MPKFEEKLKKLPIKTIQHPVGDTKYYVSVNVKSLIAQADEEFQELSEKLDDTIDALDIARNSRDEFEREYKNLKSQLQQQALPVVPDCVAEFITKVKKADNNLTFAFNSKFDECPAKYWNEAIVWRLNHPEEFALAFITGKYEVEKPQLFYLKNKLTGDCLAICLARASSGLYVEVTEKWLTRKEQTSYKLYFTQQEIDCMETGSYKQIEVEI